MPVNTNFSVPFNPQEGVTGQILQAIQLANEHHARQQGLQLQQESQPSEIALREAQTAQAKSATQINEQNLQLRREMIGNLTGNTPGATPTQDVAPPATGPIGSQIMGAASQAVPSTTKAPTGGLIGKTVSSILQNNDLTPTEQQAIKNAGNAAVLKAFVEPNTAMDGITSTFNDIMRSKQENARSIKTELTPDGNSPTGYATVARSVDGNEVYRHASPAPVPTSLDDASALLGRASLEYKRNPTDGNKASLDLYTQQHDAMYKDSMAKATSLARTEAMARGADYEAMIKTGVNPITKETLNLDNAPPMALVVPATGQVIPQDMMSLYKPTQSERQTADTARQVLAISADLKKEISANPNLIGPLAGRSKEALQSAGLSAADASKLIDDVSFLQSAATKMHTGRFSGQIMDKMGQIIKPGMNSDEFSGALQSIDDVATRYANEDKLMTVGEYKLRQQFESQPSPPTSQASKGILTMAQIEQAAKDHGVTPDVARQQAIGQGYQVK